MKIFKVPEVFTVVMEDDSVRRLRRLVQSPNLRDTWDFRGGKISNYEKWSQ